MNTNDKEKIRTSIDKKISRLKSKIATYEEMTKPISPENSIGRVSRMDAINNKSVAEAGLREAKKVLAGLEFMKSNIDKEEFGFCTKCKAKIPIERLLLLLVPQSPYCVNCSA